MYFYTYDEPTGQVEEEEEEEVIDTDTDTEIVPEAATYLTMGLTAAAACVAALI